MKEHMSHNISYFMLNNIDDNIILVIQLYSYNFITYTGYRISNVFF